MNLGQSLFSLALFGINTKGAKMMKGLDKFNKITIDVSPKIVHLRYRLCNDRYRTSLQLLSTST
jgi:hypothetical protein